jgi:hypothetical protein
METATLDVRNAVQIVQIVEDYLDDNYFAQTMQWEFYIDPSSTNVCEDCLSFNGQILEGPTVRTVFPWLTIHDYNLIYPNVHINCKCTLERVPS